MKKMGFHARLSSSCKAVGVESGKDQGGQKVKGDETGEGGRKG